GFGQDANVTVDVDGSVRADLVKTFPSVVTQWLGFLGEGKGAGFADLQKALAENHVGLQTGDCSVLTSPAPYGPVGSYDVTWYGRNLRSNHFVVTLEIFELTQAACPEEVSHLIDASKLTCGRPWERVTRKCRSQAAITEDAAAPRESLDPVTAPS